MLSGEGAGLFARGQGFISRETPTPQNTQVNKKRTILYKYFNYWSSSIDKIYIIYNVHEEVVIPSVLTLQIPGRGHDTLGVIAVGQDRNLAVGKDVPPPRNILR